MTHDRLSTFAALDFETCHTEPDSACALAVVRCENGRIVRYCAFHIRPPHRDEWMFEDLHGISREAVKDAPTFIEAWSHARTYLLGVSFLAAHNAPFDRRVLEASCKAARYLPPTYPWVDTVQVARHRHGIYPANLPAACYALGIDLGQHHDPLADATACARIILAERRVRLGAAPVESPCRDAHRQGPSPA